MKNQKGFIQIPILIAIIAGVLVLSGGGYWGVRQYQNYRTEKKKFTETNKKAEEEKQKKLQELLDSQSKELERQKTEIETLKKKPSVIVNTPNKSGELSRADIITQWTPSIAYIVCEFSITDSKTIANLKKYGVDADPVISAGSGFVRSIITKHSPAPMVAIITNIHVLGAHNGFSSASSCEVTLPGNHKYTFNSDDIYFQNPYGEGGEVKFIGGQPYLIPVIDAGFLWIKNPDSYIRDVATKSKLCDALPRIGDDIIILGYPGIGSNVGITATEGIISGIEDKYFVTSAKVEHGNSGGAAIYRDQNCYFGIPTFARTGTVESLARILNFKTTFTANADPTQ